MRRVPPSTVEWALRGQMAQEMAYHTGKTCVLGWAFASMVPCGDFKDGKLNIKSWLDDHVCENGCDKECNDEYLLAWTRY